jgi:nucleoside 2-deoxyribosyltransferase
MVETTEEESDVHGYLSARVSADALPYNHEICSHLKPPIKLFLPEWICPDDIPHEEFPNHVAVECIRAMQRSDFGLLLPPFGKDCAWEIGWYAGARKPMIAYIHNQTEWLRSANAQRHDSVRHEYHPAISKEVTAADRTNAMRSIDAIATDHHETYEMLLRHPVTSKKIHYLHTLDELQDLILQLVGK